MAKKTTKKSAKPARIGADKIAADAKTARLRKQAIDEINARIEGKSEAGNDARISPPAHPPASATSAPAASASRHPRRRRHPSSRRQPSPSG